jgi:hypothetical protein
VRRAVARAHRALRAGTAEAVGNPLRVRSGLSGPCWSKRRKTADVRTRGNRTCSCSGWGSGFAASTRYHNAHVGPAACGAAANRGELGSAQSNARANRRKSIPPEGRPSVELIWRAPCRCVPPSLTRIT